MPVIAMRNLVMLVLALGGTMTAAIVSGDHESPQPVEVAAHGTSVDVTVGGRPFTTFFYDPAVAKPYFHPLRSARGTVVTRGFPAVDTIRGEDRDEPHQRPMYFAHGDINGFDF